MTHTARAWIRLPSGRQFDLINPDPQTWSDEDLAMRLARTYRWGGESIWPMPLSVAQHSLTVLALREQWSAIAPDLALLELLHDAEEAFLGFDCISPLKAFLGTPFQQVSDRIMAAVVDRYSLRAFTPQEHGVHKLADNIVAASEAVHCAGWSIKEVRSVLGIHHQVLEADPVALTYGERAWEPWSAQVAAERFLERLTQLREFSR